MKRRSGKYLITNSGYFKYISFSFNKLPLQGWKIHVSSIFKTYPDVLKIVKSYCHKEKIDFKFVNKKKDVIYFLSKQIDRRASAKLVTIHQLNDKETREGLILDLVLFLKRMLFFTEKTKFQFQEKLIQNSFLK